MPTILLFAILVSTYLMAVAKRMPALIRSFRYQSFFLFLITLLSAITGRHLDLFFVAALVLVLKVIIIPHFLHLITKRINVDENLGLYVNSQLSLIAALGLTYFSWTLSKSLSMGSQYTAIAVTVSLSTVFIGAFLMMSRMKALTQVAGLLVMENGIFLLASSICGGMPFLVEISVFFDVFVSVIVMGVFVYRINSLFTHIDVDKLSELKG